MKKFDTVTHAKNFSGALKKIMYIIKNKVEDNRKDLEHQRAFQLTMFALASLVPINFILQLVVLFTI